MSCTTGMSGSWEPIFDSWKIFGSPARPNEIVCRQFTLEIERIVSKADIAKIVILGSTPEFRDLCYTFHVKKKAMVACVDISKANFYAMSKFSSFQGYEEFIQANWLDIPVASESADVIISDATFSNIPGETRHAFLKEISRILKREGAFITREDILTGEFDCRCIKKFMDKYSALVQENKMSLLEAVNVIGEIMLRISAWRHDGKTSSEFFFDELESIQKQAAERRKQKDLITLEIIRLIYKTYLLDKQKFWIIKERQALLDEFSSFFILKKEIIHTNYELADTLPIYVLEKR